jgi:dipeptidyl-peptidase-4
MLMKRFSLILLLSCCFVSLSWSQGTQSLDLKDVVTGKFRPTTVRDLLPMNDDEFYTQMNEEGTQVIKYSFRTGKQVEVLFDVATARNCPFKSFDSYSFSLPTGRHCSSPPTRIISIAARLPRTIICTR